MIYPINKILETGKRLRTFAEDVEDGVSVHISHFQLIYDERVLGRQPEVPSIVLRSHCPGDMGMLVHLEDAGYVEQFGSDESFEALAAQIVADFS